MVIPSASLTVSVEPVPALGAADILVEPDLAASGVVGRSRRHLAVILMIGAFLSKVLGFAREVVMAQVLGASLVADSFRGAITAVMMPLAFLQHEGVPAILIPMYREARENGDSPRKMAAVMLALGGVAFVLMVAVEAIGQWWVSAVVGGFVAEGQALTLEFVRVMALGMPASVMLNCLAAGDISLGRSRLTNLRASLLNVTMLIGIGLLALTGEVSALAWAFAVAFNGLAAWAIWTFVREQQLSFSGMTSGIVLSTGLEFLRRLRPLLALPIVEQGNIWIERALTSRIAIGAVASLDYARTLTDSTLPLICQPIGLSVLAGSPPKNARAQIEAIVLPVLVVALPACAFLYVFAPDVVRLIFHRGAFSESGVLLTSQALRGISVGLWAATLGWILLRVLNNSGRNVLAAVILVAAFAANVAVNLLTAGLRDAHETGMLIIGLGESARGCVLLAGIVLALECRGRLVSLILRAMIPAAVMVLVGWEIHENVSGVLPRLLVGGIACAASIVLAAMILMPTQCLTALASVRNYFLPPRRT